MDWSKILTDTGIFAIFSGLIVWLIKQLGQFYIDKNASLYKQELKNKSEQYKAELNQDLEKYKTELSLLSKKDFKLHEKRLNRIDKLYSLLSDFHNDMFKLTTGKVVTGISDDEIEKQNYENVVQASKSGNKFLSYYDKNKLYFNLKTCQLINEIIEILKKSHADFSFKYIFGHISPQVEIETIKSASEQIREKVPEIKKKLEKNFRDIIGVEE